MESVIEKENETKLQVQSLSHLHLTFSVNFALTYFDFVNKTVQVNNGICYRK